MSKRMNKFNWLFLWPSLVVLLMTTISANAVLTLRITQGIEKPIPIAVAAFKPSATGGEIAGLKQGFASTIRHNLSVSGLFDVLANSKMPSSYINPSSEHINFVPWRSTGVESLLVGEIKPLPNRRYNVSFRLLSVFGSAGRQQIIGERYRNVSANAMRALANHVSDLVYRALTGKAGAFATRIAYVQLNRTRTSYQLMIADADGFNPQSILKQSQPIMSPTWSPDGQKIAYVSFEGGKMSVWISELATGKRRKISSVQGINSAPSWSPNGRYLALALSHAGSAETNIYTIDLATGKKRQLTYGYAINTSPDWAPDGKSLLFTSNRGGNPQIYRYSFADQKITRLSFDGDYNADAKFLPDGRGIVMMHRVKTSEGETRFNIAYLDLDSGLFRVLTRGYNDESPTIAPNGQMVLYTKDRGGNTMLAEVSIDGRVHLNLPSGSGYVRAPAWGPFAS